MTKDLDWPNNPQLLLDRDILQKVLFDINRKLKELGERLDYFDNCPNNKETISRIKKLEEWKEGLWQKVGEAQIGETQDRIESLEHRMQELEGYPVGAPSALTTRVQKLEDNAKHNTEFIAHELDRHLAKIKELEEWKDNHSNYTHNIGEKVIHKKVWDEIKHLVKEADNYSWPEKNLVYGDLRACIYRLKEEIKSVDEEFEFD